MLNQSLWKYCRTEHCNELLSSFQLVSPAFCPPDKQVTYLYALCRYLKKHYVPGSIPKRDGSLRQLLVPSLVLKAVQRNILHHILATFPVSRYATAYHKDGGVVKNAAFHLGQSQLLKLDIKDFFASIHFLKVYNCAFPSDCFPPAIRALLTHLCCYDDYLPQGAPTSPAISNLVMKTFDDYIGQWCLERGITYSRYCDDMTFSGSFNCRQVKNKVRAYLEAMGFELNEKKTQLIKYHSRQQVTGIVVNQKMQLSKQYRKALRQEIHYLLKYGVVSHINRREYMKYHPLTDASVKQYLQSVLGKVQFILQVNPNDRFFQNAKYVILTELCQLA